jgi:hypothetical protein
VATSKKATRMAAAYEAAQGALDKLLQKYGVEADPWSSRIYGAAAYLTKPKDTPPAGTLGGRRIRGATVSSGAAIPAAGTLGGRRARGKLPKSKATGVGRVPEAGTLGGVKVR